jgi:hypothetical protein
VSRSVRPTSCVLSPKLSPRVVINLRARGLAATRAYEAPDGVDQDRSDQASAVCFSLSHIGSRHRGACQRYASICQFSVLVRPGCGLKMIKIVAA